MKNFILLLRNELRLEIRQLNDWAALVLFFVLILFLLPFAIGSESDLLRRLAPGLIWLAALLMNLLALERLFVADARDGTLDLMRLSPLPLPLIVSGKLFAHILIMLFVLMAMLVPAALIFNMNAAVSLVLLISLLLGVPVLVFMGGMIGAITVALNRSPALLTLLLIPLYIPTLIFAVAACDAAQLGNIVRPHLLLLGAMLALLSPIAPFVIAGALRNMQE